MTGVLSLPGGVQGRRARLTYWESDVIDCDICGERAAWAVGYLPASARGVVSFVCGDHLEVVCPTCNGDGRPVSPGSLWPTASNPAVILPGVCSRCEGAGIIDGEEVRL